MKTKAEMKTKMKNNENKNENENQNEFSSLFSFSLLVFVSILVSVFVFIYVFVIAFGFCFHFCFHFFSFFVFFLFLLSKSFCVFVNSTWPRGAIDGQLYLDQPRSVIAFLLIPRSLEVSQMVSCLSLGLEVPQHFCL